MVPFIYWARKIDPYRSTSERSLWHEASLIWDRDHAENDFFWCLGKKNNSGFSILHIKRFPREKWPVVGQKFDHRFVYKPRAVSVEEFVCFRELNILQPGAWLTNQQDAACCNCAPPTPPYYASLPLPLSLRFSLSNTDYTYRGYSKRYTLILCKCTESCSLIITFHKFILQPMDFRKKFEEHPHIHSFLRPLN
jgi:hypothetical protein